jgi:hypothetical protein
MNLEALVKHKSDQLLLKRAALQQSLHARINTRYFSSFFITFVIAPFIVGAFTRFTVKPLSVFSIPFYRIYRTLLSRMLLTAQIS